MKTAGCEEDCPYDQLHKEKVANVTPEDNFAQVVADMVEGPNDP
jgi:hypothetical protein